MMTSPDAGARIHWEPRDAFPGLTAIALMGSVGFVGLAAFGLPNVEVHSPLHYLGVMDPLCGMTRAMYWLSAGDAASAWRFNPGSFAVAAFGMTFTSRALVGRVTGKWLEVALLSRRVVWFILAVAILTLWVNQQAHADLLTT